MKITTLKTPPCFSPVRVTFFCETQQELDALGSMFNCAPISDTLRELGAVNLAARFHEPFKAAGANIHMATRFCERMAKHSALQKFLK